MVWFVFDFDIVDDIVLGKDVFLWREGFDFVIVIVVLYFVFRSGFFIFFDCFFIFYKMSGNVIMLEDE